MEDYVKVKSKELHQLKSQLAALSGYLQLIQSILSSSDIQSQEKALELLEKAIKTYNNLENSIKKIQSKKL
jgi:hypothetical protein